MLRNYTTYVATQGELDYIEILGSATNKDVIQVTSYCGLRANGYWAREPSQGRSSTVGRRRGS